MIMKMMMMQQMNKTSALKHTDLNFTAHTLQTTPETHYSINIHIPPVFPSFPKDSENGRSIIVEDGRERAFRSRPAVVGDCFLEEELHRSLQFQAEFCLKQRCFAKNIQETRRTPPGRLREGIKEEAARNLGR